MTFNTTLYSRSPTDGNCSHAVASGGAGSRLSPCTCFPKSIATRVPARPRSPALLRSGPAAGTCSENACAGRGSRNRGNATRAGAGAAGAGATSLTAKTDLVEQPRRAARALQSRRHLLLGFLARSFFCHSRRPRRQSMKRWEVVAPSWSEGQQGVRCKAPETVDRCLYWEIATPHA